MSVPSPAAPSAAAGPVAPGGTTPADHKNPTTPAVNVTPANPNPNPVPGSPKLKLKKDDRVNHPASPDGTHVAGIGTVLAVDEATDTVTVACQDRTNMNFKLTDLTEAKEK